MGLMSKIFGQNATGENGLSIFTRHAAAALKNDLSVHKPWEFMLITGMGALLGAFIGAAVMAGAMYAEDGSLTVERPSLEDRTNAPGIDPGAAAGATGMFYFFFAHKAMADSLRETRKQIAPQPNP